SADRHATALPLGMYRSARRSAFHGAAIHPGRDDVVAFRDVRDPVALGHDDAGRLVPQQRREHGRCATVRCLGGAMHLVQLGVADPAGEQLQQHLIRLWIGERHVVDDQGSIRFDEDRGPGARWHRVSSVDQNIGPRFAAPPSMVMIVPVVYAERSDARKATITPISSAMPARPMGSGFINSSQRPSSPRRSLARPFMMVIRRSVAIAPGLMPTTRRPSSPAEPPSALVTAIGAALPVEPAI